MPNLEPNTDGAVMAPSIDRMEWQKCLRFVLNFSSASDCSGLEQKGPQSQLNVVPCSKGQQMCPGTELSISKSFIFHKSKANRDMTATGPHWFTAALEGKQWLSLISYKSLATCQVQRPHNPVLVEGEEPRQLPIPVWHNTRATDQCQHYPCFIFRKVQLKPWSKFSSFHGRSLCDSDYEEWHCWSTKRQSSTVMHLCFEDFWICQFWFR